jgi:hypothetical protein
MTEKGDVLWNNANAICIRLSLVSLLYIVFLESQKYYAIIIAIGSKKMI